MRDCGAEFVNGLVARVPGLVAREAGPYLAEPRGRYVGAGYVVAPADVEGVSAVMAACYEACVPVVPYGGGTGLVGGQICAGTVPLVVSVERMASVRAVDPVGQVLEVEAGVTLEAARAAAADAGRMFPLALASQGSARIGGVLATNAGGVNVLRYGMARALCLGVEAVLADGRIYRGLSGLRKDNTGYDLRDLLIGSEGSLGVITAASLRLVPLPAQQAAAVMAVDSPSAALELLALAQGRLGEALSAFELISGQGLRFMQETDVPFRCPLQDVPDWAVLLDLGVGAGQDPSAMLADLFEAAGDLVTDGVISSSDIQRAALWQMREHIPEGNRRIGSIMSHDIAVPIARIAEFIEQAGAAMRGFGDLRVNCFGHLGDGNLHYNVFPPSGRDRSEYAEIRDDIQRAIHDLVAAFDGSFSAEHGVGRLKVGDLERYGDPVKMQMMRAIKDALDPKGILNPGAVLRDQSPS